MFFCGLYDLLRESKYSGVGLESQVKCLCHTSSVKAKVIFLVLVTVHKTKCLQSSICLHKDTKFLKCWGLLFMGDNKPSVFTPVCLTHLSWMCLITCGWEVHRFLPVYFLIYQDIYLSLIGCRLEVPQVVCLLLIGPDGKCNEVQFFPLKPFQNLFLGYFLGNWVWTWPESIYLTSI